MKELILLTSLLLAAGCTTFTEQDLDKREFERIGYLNRIAEFEHPCNEIGGLVHIHRWGDSSHLAGGPDASGEYWCAKNHSN